MKNIAIAFTLAGLLALALPALAGNTCETATPLVWDGAFSGGLAAGEVIWYKGSGGTNELFVLNMLHADGCTIEVLSGDCSAPVVVAGPFTAIGNYSLPTPLTGDYYIRVTGLAEALFYYFSLTESNDSCGEGVLMSMGEFYDGDFHHEEDFDWFQLSLSAGDCLQVNVQPRDELDYAACSTMIMDLPNTCSSGMHGLTGGPEGVVFLTTVDQDGVYSFRLDVNSYYPSTFPAAYRIYVDDCEAIGTESLDWGALKTYYR